MIMAIGCMRWQLPRRWGVDSISSSVTSEREDFLSYFQQIQRSGHRLYAMAVAATLGCLA